MGYKPIVCDFANYTGPAVQWSGWVIYYWDMRNCVAYFDERPECYGQGDGWSFRRVRREGCCPYVLRHLGSRVKFDRGHNFYYGRGCSGGMHPPMQITIHAPALVLSLLGLL